MRKTHYYILKKAIKKIREINTINCQKSGVCGTILGAIFKYIKSLILYIFFVYRFTMYTTIVAFIDDECTDSKQKSVHMKALSHLL